MIQIEKQTNKHSACGAALANQGSRLGWARVAADLSYAHVTWSLKLHDLLRAPFKIIPPHERMGTSLVGLEVVITLIILVLVATPANSANDRRDVRPLCAGVSPTGVKWVYIQPQHTATAAVSRALVRATHTRCRHAHDWGGEDTDALADEGYVAFTFLQNPFKRVLTHANFLRKAESTGILNVTTFRDYVYMAYGGGKYKIAVSGKLKGADQVAATNSISRLMGNSHARDLFGRVSHLQDDLVGICKKLGYGESALKELAKFLPFHCISTCLNTTDTKKNDKIHGDNRRHQVIDPRSDPDSFKKLEKAAQENPLAKFDWFDDFSAKLVIQVYEEDFRRYGFSKNPKDMWTDTGTANSFEANEYKVLRVKPRRSSTFKFKRVAH